MKPAEWPPQPSRVDHSEANIFRNGASTSVAQVGRPLAEWNSANHASQSVGGVIAWLFRRSGRDDSRYSPTRLAAAIAARRGILQ